jgi:two-component system, OmpR family, phosphate regulon response regulator PhoB
VDSTRIVRIEEAPLIERLVSLFERPDEELPAHHNGERVCEAHLLAPNLILLDLTRAAADQTESRRPRDVEAAGAASVLKLALKKEAIGQRAEDPSASPVEPASDSMSEDPPPVREPMTDTAAMPLAPVLQMGPVRIDRHGHWAYLDEKKLHLTPTEFRMLECFLREPGRAFTRSQLLDVSIGNASFVLERTIDVHIRSLRTKLGAARELIETVRGVGYRFRENEELR